MDQTAARGTESGPRSSTGPPRPPETVHIGPESDLRAKISVEIGDGKKKTKKRKQPVVKSWAVGYKEAFQKLFGRQEHAARGHPA